MPGTLGVFLEKKLSHLTDVELVELLPKLLVDPITGDVASLLITSNEAGSKIISYMLPSDGQGDKYFMYLGSGVYRDNILYALGFIYGVCPEMERPL